VSRQPGVGLAGDGLDTAITALSMGKIQWLGDTSGQAQRTVRVKLASIPKAFQQVLKNNRQQLAQAIRSTLGWRMVLCEDGHTLTETTNMSPTQNRFAALANDTNNDAPHPSQGAPTTGPSPDDAHNSVRGVNANEENNPPNLSPW